jgi:hypothetical protein
MSENVRKAATSSTDSLCGLQRSTTFRKISISRPVPPEKKKAAGATCVKRNKIITSRDRAIRLCRSHNVNWRVAQPILAKSRDESEEKYCRTTAWQKLSGRPVPLKKTGNIRSVLSRSPPAYLNILTKAANIRAWKLLLLIITSVKKYRVSLRWIQEAACALPTAEPYFSSRVLATGNIATSSIANARMRRYPCVLESLESCQITSN